MPFIGIGNVDFDDYQVDSTPTFVGSRTVDLTVDDVEETLFLSIKWRLVLMLNGCEFVNSKPSYSPHTPAYTRRWVRLTLRKFKRELTQKGLNVRSEYLKWGGSVDDL